METTMQLKKISLAVALGAAAVAPAALAQSSVQLYGKLYPYLLDERGSGATEKGVAVSTLAAKPDGTSGVGSVRGMESGNSRIGFRGTEDLGGGLKARFQLESQLAVDSGAGSADAGGLMFNRNTYVGLDGRFGELKLGVHDTIFKEYGDTIGFLGVSSGTFMSTSSVLRKAGFGSSSSSSFHLRRANSIIYETPAAHATRHRRCATTRPPIRPARATRRLSSPSNGAPTSSTSSSSTRSARNTTKARRRPAASARIGTWLTCWRWKTGGAKSGAPRRIT
jgi:hypothetical protein